MPTKKSDSFDEYREDIKLARRIESKGFGLRAKDKGILYYPFQVLLLDRTVATAEEIEEFFKKKD